MGMRVKRSVLAGLCRAVLIPSVLLVADVCAQEMRVVEGRRYIVHTVQQGQTLYAIARANAVSVEELLRANTGAADGLSIGEEILIPQDEVDRKALRTAPELGMDGMLRHTVQRKETLFGLSRSYGVAMDSLLAANPAAAGGLREGMVLIVPVRAVTGQAGPVVRPAEPTESTEHSVQPAETLYGLAQRYGTTVEAIQAANGGLAEGLKEGMVIIVPVPPGTEPRPAPVAIVTDAPAPAAPRSKFSITYLLPFSVNRNDSALLRDPVQPRFHDVTRMAASFYAGARMALDTLEAAGFRAEVRVKDSGETPVGWSRALRYPGPADTDLYIGPFHRAAIEQLARSRSGSHIVCPVPQSNRVLLGMTNVSKASPARSDLLGVAARYATQGYAHENIVLLRPAVSADKDGQEQLHRILNETLAEQENCLRDSVLVARPGKRDVSAVLARLDAKRLNVLVTSCEDVEFVTSLVSSLKRQCEKYRYRILLIGSESWMDMETVALEDLDKLQFTFPVQGYADPANADVRNFVNAFQQRYRTDVDDYAFLGYDITRFYAKALMSGLPLTGEGLAQVPFQPLYQGFRLTGTGPGNGLRNDYGIMLRQQDLQLVPAPTPGTMGSVGLRR
jgi:LysM repeat protein